MDKQCLIQHRKNRFGRDELASIAQDLQEQLGLQQGDRRVRPLDSRTVRYLQGRGLVDVPERNGKAVFYGYLQLIQLLTIRQLQSEGCSLDAIGKLVDDGKLPWRSTGHLEEGLLLTSEALMSSASEITQLRPDAKHIATELIPGVIVLVDTAIVDDPQSILNQLAGSLAGPPRCPAKGRD